MRIPFHHEKETGLRHPTPACVPSLKSASLTALYHSARLGGDFFDFMPSHTRVVFVLLDIAGRREEALHIASFVQDHFREFVPKRFDGAVLNEADAVTDLTIELNRTILQAAGGVRCAPAFIGSFDEVLGTLQYINAGHAPGLVRDREEVTLLPSNGLPLGLFSHATHDAQFCVLPPGCALLIASKGMIESRAGHHELGIEGLQKMLAEIEYKDARDLCSGVVNRVFERSGSKQPENDLTALGLVRFCQAAAVTAGD